jgi:hypothetical protein
MRESKASSPPPVFFDDRRQDFDLPGRRAGRFSEQTVSDPSSRRGKDNLPQPAEIRARNELEKFLDRSLGIKGWAVALILFCND